MSESVRPWEWNEQRECAALLLAEDELTGPEIGAALDVNPKTLERWRKVPEFQARVEELCRELAAGPRKHAIAKRNRRVSELQREWQDLEEQRQSLLELLAASTDAGERLLLLKEIRAITKLQADLMQRAAIEVGDWSEKREVSGSMRVQQAVEHLSDEELERIARGEGGGNP